MSQRESRREASLDVGCCEVAGKLAGQQERDSGLCGTVGVAALNDENKAKGLFISRSRQRSSSRAGRAWLQDSESEELYQPCADLCSHGRRMC